MAGDVEQQFLDLFKDFINICQLQNWPKNDTNVEEIKHVFFIAQHIEKCLDKLQSTGFLNEFLFALNKNLNTTSQYHKIYLSDPLKYILKKIINSPTTITVMDLGIKVFIDMFSEEKLEEYLSDIMLETASKETLLKNMSTELSLENRLEFKSHLLLSRLSDKECSSDVVQEMLKSCTQDVMDILVLCLINKDSKYDKAVNVIANEFENIMANLNVVNKKFWKFLLRTDADIFLQMCLSHSRIFELISKALIDCGKLINNCMSMELFYIELTYSELVSIVQKICKDESLKLEFTSLVHEKDVDLTFWTKLL